jgi:hypothetical protein
VTVDVIHRFRLAEALQIGGRGEDMEVHGEELALDQVRLGRGAQPDRDIRLPHGHVEFAVVEDEFKPDSRMNVYELVDARRKPCRAKAYRGRDAQHARRLPARIDELGAHLVELVHDVARRAHQQLALLGEDQPAGVTMEQRRAELSFQRADLPAYRRLAHVQRLAGARERARGGGRVENPELVPIHRFSPGA